MNTLRRSDERGRFTNDWLDARFSFSFGDWIDPAWPAFGPLRALNEDRVQPGRGFALHPHRNLEILMLPRSGRIAHRDDAGGQAEVHPGSLHFMRAGRGIRHSQMNPSLDTVDHHLQIWIEPRTRDLPPQVQTLPLPLPRAGHWVVLASDGGAAGGAPLDADVTVALGRVDAGAPLTLPGQAGRRRYLHVVEGTVSVDGQRLGPGDARAEHAVREPRSTVQADSRADVLVFDLPPA